MPAMMFWSVGKEGVPGPVLGFITTSKVTVGWAAMVVVTEVQAVALGPG